MEYKFSVIIPAYNSEKTLPETLNCILRQSAYNETQIIAVNDGSTDRTPEILDKFSSEFKNITVINQANSGVSAARNVGISAAKGKYMIFLDADDLIKDDNALNNIFDKMEQKQAQLGIFRLMHFGFGGNEYNPIVEKLAASDDISFDDRRLLQNYLVLNKCYLTQTLKSSNIAFPPTVYCEDGAFFVSFLMMQKPRITGIFDATAKYRRISPYSGHQVTQSIDRHKVEDFEKSSEIITEAVDNFYDKPDKDDYLQAVYLKICGTLINEFYRKLLIIDDDTLTAVGKIYEKYYSLLGEEERKKLKYSDLSAPVFNRSQLFEHPMISVKVKKPTDEFLNSLRCQTTPQFEILTSDKEIVGNFGNINSGKPKSKIIVSFSGKNELDPRLLSGILKLKAKFGFMSASVLKATANVYLKYKDNKNK